MKVLERALVKDKEARTLADYALASAEQSSKDKYHKSEAFAQDALTLARSAAHLSALAKEWLGMPVGEDYLVEIIQCDFYAEW